MTELVDLREAEVALDRAPGHAFEDFILAVYPAIAGEEFVPLGGTHDGGADAFQERVFEGKKTTTFYQATREENHRSKIKKTVDRLKGFGREPRTITLLTSRVVEHIDIEEEHVESLHGVRVRIRDRKWILGHINDSPGTRAAYLSYLAPHVSFLSKANRTNLLIAGSHAADPSVYVFLRHEIDRKRGDRTLVNAVADGLILWALEGTDPSADSFLTEAQIRERIEQVLPGSMKIVGGVIRRRLTALSKIPEVEGRPIRAYSKQNKYCLSFEIRKQVQADNTLDESARIAFEDSIRARATSFLGAGAGPADPSDAEIVVSAINRSVRELFQQHGLALSAFIKGENADPDFRPLADYVDAYLHEQSLSPEKHRSLLDAALKSLRGLFYDSDERERDFLGRLSDTYTLLFCLQADPRVVEYFQSMAANFRLYVGSDILIRALSERYLRPADQRMRNTLSLLRQAGADLILCDPVLEEVYTHIRAADLEFVNYYAPAETSISILEASNCNRILIRAYLYGKLSPPEGVVAPATWDAYLNHIAPRDRIQNEREGSDYVRRYLIGQFGLKEVTRERMKASTASSEVERLTKELLHTKSRPELAENDALIVNQIYADRLAHQERSGGREFGFRTWWLSGESRILRHASHLIDRHGARFLIRPDFLLNFLTLAPSTSELRLLHRETFPAVSGLRLARRVEPERLKKVLREYRAAQDLEPARRSAEMARISDTLKSDYLRAYTNHFDDTEEDRGGD